MKLFASIFALVAVANVQGAQGGGNPHTEGAHQSAAPRSVQHQSAPAPHPNRPASHMPAERNPAPQHAKTFHQNAREPRSHVSASPIRSPSMSRAEYRMSAPTHQAQRSQPTQFHAPTTRPQAEQRGFQNRPNREEIRQRVQQISSRELNRQITSQKQEHFKATFSKRQTANREASRNVRNRVMINHPGAHSWFSDEFFNSHHYHPYYHHQGDRWWKRQGWNGITTWIYNWNYPIYYDDDGYPVPLSSDTENYIQPDTFSSDYYTSEGDWQPLGVFVSARNIASAPYSHAFVQLAVDKEGDIAGTYYNDTTNEAHPLEGYVDKDTQQAIWKVADNPDSPFMTTGIYNLTQDVATVQVHFPDDTVQNFVLVRLDD